MRDRDIVAAGSAFIAFLCIFGANDDIITWIGWGFAAVAAVMLPFLPVGRPRRSSED